MSLQVAKFAFKFWRNRKRKKKNEENDSEDPEDEETAPRSASWKDKATAWIWDKVTPRRRRTQRQYDDDSDDPEDGLDEEGTTDNRSWAKKVIDWFSGGVNTLSRAVSRRSAQHDDSDNDSDNDSDIELGGDGKPVTGDKDDEIGKDNFDEKLKYDRDSRKARLLVCFGAKRALTRSKIVRLPYRTWCKYLMIVLLVLVGIFFTPQLMPNWAGYKLSTAERLCTAKEDKLKGVETLVKNLTKIQAGEKFVEEMTFMNICFRRSAGDFYIRPNRFQWPDECTEEKAGQDFSREVCNPKRTYTKKKCMGGATGFFGKVFGGKTCVDVTVERKCVTVKEGSSDKALLELYREQAAADKQKANETVHRVGNVVSDKAEKLMRNLIWKIDIASNLFIGYTVLALIVAVPFRVHQSEKKTRFVGALFSLSKFKWILIVLAFWTAFEGLSKAFKEANWKLYMANLGTDPCYVDANFTAQRLKILGDACENVSETYIKADQELQELDTVYFKTRLFGMCKENATDNPKHPAEEKMLEIREMYQNNTFKNPAICNMTLLHRETEIAPKSEYSSFRIVMSTGVVPEILLKFVLTSLIVNVITFFEPMVAYSGQVELWDKKELDPEEEENVKKFARDKRILPLVTTIIAAVFTLISLVWGLTDKKAKHNQGNELVALINSTAPPAPSPSPFECPEGFLKPRN